MAIVAALAIAATVGTCGNETDTTPKTDIEKVEAVQVVESKVYLGWYIDLVRDDKGKTIAWNFSRVEIPTCYDMAAFKGVDSYAVKYVGSNKFWLVQYDGDTIIYHRHSTSELKNYLNN